MLVLVAYCMQYLLLLGLLIGVNDHFVFPQKLFLYMVRIN
jgi:hypothetical protein